MNIDNIEKLSQWFNWGLFGLLTFVFLIIVLFALRSYRQHPELETTQAKKARLLAEQSPPEDVPEATEPPSSVTTQKKTGSPFVGGADSPSSDVCDGGGTSAE
jgi:hypothetical protein